MRNPADGKAAFNFNNEAAQDRGDTSENESNVHNVCVHPQTVSYLYIARTVYCICCMLPLHIHQDLAKSCAGETVGAE